MKKGKILVVDDNQGIRSALKILLPAHFAEVEIIASPKSLVTTMESFHPDVVLLDMNFYTDINTGTIWYLKSQGLTHANDRFVLVREK